ncbi:MAG: hypothetical protein QF582_18595, partial [Alphaproteobacteria bacterium]|nr:hypothetical protein [Alphaproteobacteria bacterium]
MPEETNRILNDLRARLALGTALATMALGGYGGRPAYAGACTGAAGIYLCSGAANPATDLTQTLNPGAPLTVTTTPGFGIDTSTNGGNALTLTGTGGLSFTDGYNAAITGAATGIRALGQGEYDYSYGYGPGTIPGSGGALHITMAGRVTGLSGHGIDAENTEDGSDLTISAATVDGGNAGIFAHNEGTGYLSISASGPVTGTLGDGIYGKNFGTALSVTAAAVTGGRDGIDARNEGTAGLSISVSGDVTGQSVDGISAFNSANDVSGSMLITQAASTTTSGAVHGIDADNAGGALTINALGTSTGGSGDGIHALNRAGTTALDITANNAHGGANGIVADNAGGALTINAYGSASGGTGDGIRAVNQAGATGLTITANNADGGASGIRADNQGSGALRITATGQVTGSGTGQAFSNAGVDGGIVARNSSATATDLTIDASGQVTGAGRYGIYARNDGTGDLRVTTTGQVTGWVRPDGRRYEAIVAYNFGRDLTIAATAGYAHGITAVNSGSGALRITTATTSNGRMFAINTGTDLTIAAAAVSSGFQGGIYAYN